MIGEPQRRETYQLRPPPPFKDPFKAREERERARRAALLPAGASPVARAFLVNRGEAAPAAADARGPKAPAGQGAQVMNTEQGGDRPAGAAAPYEPHASHPPGNAADVPGLAADMPLPLISKETGSPGKQAEPAPATSAPGPGIPQDGPDALRPGPQAGPALPLFPERETTDVEDALAQYRPAPTFEWVGALLRVTTVPLIVNGRKVRVFWAEGQDGSKYSTSSADLGGAALALACSGDRARVVFRRTLRGNEFIEITKAA